MTMTMTMTVTEPATALTGPPSATSAPNSITLTVTTAGLFDVLTNTVRAVGGADIAGRTSVCRLRLHLTDARLHATGTDRVRLHRDWTPLLDNTPARLPEPLLLTTRDVATLRALLRRRLTPALRSQPATLTAGPLSADGVLRPIRLTVGPRGHADSLTVLSLADPILTFPDIAALETHFPDWGTTDATCLNPQFIADAARLTHDGRPVGPRTGLEFHFRAARPDDCPAPVRLTHPGRPSWTADVMPIRLDAR